MRRCECMYACCGQRGAKQQKEWEIGKNWAGPYFQPFMAQNHVFTIKARKTSTPSRKMFFLPHMWSLVSHFLQNSSRTPFLDKTASLISFFGVSAYMPFMIPQDVKKTPFAEVTTALVLTCSLFAGLWLN